MPGLVPGTHALLAAPKTWAAGTSPAMTRREADRAKSISESCPALCRAPTPCLRRPRKTWVAGTSPAMTRRTTRRNRGDEAMKPHIAWLMAAILGALSADQALAQTQQSVQATRYGA